MLIIDASGLLLLAIPPHFIMHPILHVLNCILLYLHPLDHMIGVSVLFFLFDFPATKWRVPSHKFIQGLLANVHQAILEE